MFWACSDPRPNAYLGVKCYFPTVGIFLSIALILAIWICWICVLGMISIYIFFHLFFVVYSYKQRICMEIFLYGFLSYGNKYSYRNFLWKLVWQFSFMATQMEIFLYGFYKENFHTSTCFLIDFCLLIICLLFCIPILSYFNHF